MKRAFFAMFISSLAFAQGITGAPVIGPAPTWFPPAPENRPLKNGAFAWVVTQPGLPLTTVSWVVPAGNRHESAAQSGLASLTAAALHECGAGKRDPQELQEAFEDLGASLQIETSVEGTTFTFTVLSSRLEGALALLFDLLSQPRFDAAAFEALKARRVSELKTSFDEAPVMAEYAGFRALFGEQPEGREGDGVAATVEKLKLEDVKAFHAARYGSAGSIVVVVGDLKPEVVKQQFDALAPKAWLTAPSSTVEKEPTFSSPKWLGVNKKDAPQTVVLGLAPGAKWATSETMALSLAADVLGGSFTSRLNQNIREKHGYSYGARASSTPGRNSGVLDVMTPVRTDVSAAALEQIVLELRGLTSLSADEHRKALALANAAAVESFSSTAGVAAVYARIALLGGNVESYRFDYARLQRVAAGESKAETAKFNPDAFTFVLVGDKTAIDAQFKKTFPARKLEWVEVP